MMSRTKEREYLFKLIFQLILNPSFVYDPLSSEYLLNSFENIRKNLQEIDNKLKSVIVSWDYNEIGNVEKALLILACYEMLYAKIHPKIVINEVVELSKTYGDENSSKFINGILAKIVDETEVSETDKVSQEEIIKRETKIKEVEQNTDQEHE